MQHDEKVRRIFATVVVVGILTLVIFATARYFTALFAAFLLFFLFRPMYLWFHEKKELKKSWAASFTMAFILLVIIIPLTFGVGLVVQEIASGVNDAGALLSNFDELDARFPSVDLTGMVEEQYQALSTYTRSLFVSALNNATKFLISLLITFFVLYFLLTSSNSNKKSIMRYIPFNEKHAERLWKEFENVTHATVVSTGLIALMQGVLLGVGFWIFGIPGAVFWGFMGLLISFLPLVGVPLIWGPAGVLQLLAGNIGAGIGIIIWGSVVSTIDNFLRPYIQKKVGEVHPLITIVGVFAGLPLFGLMGLILGPLLLSYAFLITQMYMEEYV